MNDPNQHPDFEKRRRNLQSVARKMMQAKAEAADGKPKDGATKTKSRWAGKLARWGPVGVLLIFVLGKLKLVIPLVKMAKLQTLVTMLFAVWVYAQIWGFVFALGFVLLILIHEFGHLIAMRRMGIKAGAPVIIPFVGAVIAMRSLPRDAYVEAFVGIGGPALGTLSALVCLLIGFSTDSLFWHALASTGFLINLFNMLPISPLDGGRIVGVMSRWIWLIGYILGISLFFLTWSPILFLILLLGLMGLGRTLRGHNKKYYDIAPSKRWKMGMAFFLLLAIMVLGMWTADAQLEGIHPATQAEPDV